ncbi:MAG TPA: DUF6049 family protein [Acidimicrobiales bacterium]
MANAPFGVVAMAIPVLVAGAAAAIDTAAINTLPPTTGAAHHPVGRAQTDDPDVADPLTIDLASQTAVVRPGGTWVLRIHPEGLGPTPPAEPPSDPAGDDAPDPGPDEPQGERAQVRIRVHGRLTSRSAFETSIQGVGLDAAVADIAADIGQLGRDSTGALVVRLPLAGGGRPPDPDAGALLSLPREGVYPVTVELRQGERSALLVTHLVRAPDPDTDPLELAVIVPVHARPATTAVGEPALTERTTARIDRLVSSLASAPSIPVVLAPTPETLAALAATEPEALTRLAERAATDHVLVRPYVPLDARSLVAGGFESVIGTALTTGADAVADHLGARPGTRTWLTDRPIDAATVTALRGVGVDQLVTTSSAVQSTGRSLTLAEPLQLEGTSGRRIRAALADDGLAAHLSGPDAASAPVLSAHRFLADLAMLLFDEPGRTRGVMVLAPVGWDPDPQLLDTLLGGLSDSPIVRPASINEWFDALDPATDALGDPLVLAPVDAPLRPIPSGIGELLERVASFTTMVAPDAGPIEQFERALLSALSIDHGASSSAEVAAVADALESELAAVGTADVRSITLTARTGEIPVTLRNNAAYPVEVLISLDADKLEFPDGSERTLVLAPGNTTARFTVEARTSGTFPLLVSVASPDGVLDLGVSRYTIRSTAVSGVGIILTAGSLIFLIGWWSTHLRRTPSDGRADLGVETDERDGASDPGDPS